MPASVKQFTAETNALLKEKTGGKMLLKVLGPGSKRPASVAHCTYDRQAGKGPKKRVGLYIFERQTSCRESRKGKPRTGVLQCVASIVINLSSNHIYARVHKERQKHGLYALLSAITIQFLNQCKPKHLYVADCVVFSSAAVLKSFIWEGKERERAALAKAVSTDRKKAEAEFRRMVVTVDPQNADNVAIAGKIITYVLNTIKFKELCMDTPRLTTVEKKKKKPAVKKAWKFQPGRCYHVATGVPAEKNPDVFLCVSSVVNGTELHYVMYRDGKKVNYNFVMHMDDWDRREEPVLRLQQKFCPVLFPSVAPEWVISWDSPEGLSRNSLRTLNSLPH